MATTNYAFEKRRRELEKKAKKEAKRRHKLEAASARASEDGRPEPGDADPTDEDASSD